MTTRSARALGVGVVLAVLAGCGQQSPSGDGAALSTSPVSTSAASASASSEPGVTTTAPVETAAAASEAVVPVTSIPAASPVVTTAPATTVAPAPATAIPQPVERSGADISPDEPVGDPLSISIPSIGVESSLVAAGVLEDGTVAVPPDPNIAGWFTGGPRPGERGPAVIMGHVDSKKSGPGVFWRLVDLDIGALVTVETTTGPQQFVVQSVEQYPKDQFPTERVYGPLPQPALRLITCGGSFDRAIGHYRDNIIAFLVPVVV